MKWRKSSRSVNDGACVEVASAHAAVLVRDTENRSGPVIRYPVKAWAAFTAGLKEGAA